MASYWGVAIPLGYWLSLGKEDGWGVVGLTTGMTAGTWMHFCLMWVLVSNVEWGKVADTAALGLEEQGEGRGDEGVGLVSGGDLEGSVEMVPQREVEGEGFFGGMVKVSSATKAKKQGYERLGTDLDDAGNECEEDKDNADELLFGGGGAGGIGLDRIGGEGDNDDDGLDENDLERLRLEMDVADAETSMDRLR